MSTNKRLVSPLNSKSEEDFALDRLIVTTKAGTFLEWAKRWGQANSLWRFHSEQLVVQLSSWPLLVQNTIHLVLVQRLFASLHANQI